MSWQDLIMAAPENPHRYRDLAEEVFVFKGVGLTQLAVLGGSTPPG
jgi:hypothetical protein